MLIDIYRLHFIFYFIHMVVVFVQYDESIRNSIILAALHVDSNHSLYFFE